MCGNNPGVALRGCSRNNGRNLREQSRNITRRRRTAIVRRPSKQKKKKMNKKKRYRPRDRRRHAGSIRVCVTSYSRRISSHRSIRLITYSAGNKDRVLFLYVPAETRDVYRMINECCRATQSSRVHTSRCAMTRMTRSI